MKLCISLDLPSAKENLSLVNKVKNHDLWLKVGLRSYVRDGQNFLKDLKGINPNFKIFLDLKLYDIPNTMADTAEEIAKFFLVDMFNVHASSGVTAMSTVMQRIKEIPNKPLVLGVTALTSFDEESFTKIYNASIRDKVLQFSKDSKISGLNGVVCSAYESLGIKKNIAKDFITLCPGIRSFGEDTKDQQRVANIEFAKGNDIDFIVIGRPIYQASDQNYIVNKILEKIQ